MSQRPQTRSNRVPFILTLLIVLAVGIGLYMKAQSRPDARRVRVALVTWNQDPFWDPVIQGAKDAANEFNADLTVVQSEPNLESQNGHLRDLLSRGVEGMAISPNDPKAQSTLLKEIADKGELVTIDIDAPESQRRVFVGIDNYSAGHFLAEEVREALPDGGAVIISVGSIDMQHGRDRRQGLIDGLLDRPYRPEQAESPDPLESNLSGTKYSVVATVVDKGDTARSAELVATALKAHPEARCVVGLFSYSAGAALKAIDQVEKHGQIQVIAFDESDETQAGIASGLIHSSILQDQYRIGHESIRVLADEIRSPSQKGPTGPRIAYVALNTLNKDNMELLRQSRNIRVPKQPTTQPGG